jgi:cobalt-zinc-cadmium efflux system protein
MEVASAHLMIRAGTDGRAVRDQARTLLRDNHHIGHTTLQIEPDNHTGCDEVAR